VGTTFQIRNKLHKMIMTYLALYAVFPLGCGISFPKIKRKTSLLIRRNRKQLPGTNNSLRTHYTGLAMPSKHLLLSLACAAVLAGCAAPKAVPPPAPPTMASMLEQADAALKLGKPEDAVAVLKSAARIYPADKTAWLRIAQVSFDCQEYGEAITHARKVLERDPDDIVAHSLVAVSGLRVSSKALADLSVKKRVTGDVREAAQDLARILRASIGGDIIPAPGGRKNPVLKPALTVVKTPTDMLNDILNQPNEGARK
jgi:tetratricopeptide (TPR) repeat protein